MGHGRKFGLGPLLGLAALLSASGARAENAGSVWPDTQLGRLAALATIETLNAEVLASRSATTTLEAWCAAHHLAAEPRLVAHRLAVADKSPTGGQRQALGVDPAEPVRYRQVELRCGEHVLSVAENWYVPSRLTADMNAALETTETPFGKVIQPLGPTRQPLSATLLWSPLPAGWETRPLPRDAGPGLAIALPPALFEHRAIVRDRDGRALALVVETYQRDLLGFQPPL
jgi:hypothetical protein